MEFLVSPLIEFFTSPPFLNAFWVFIGIVAGALIQHYLGILNQKKQMQNALKALHTEIDMNLDAIQSFRTRLNYLRDRITAKQIEDSDIIISMHDFDYSILSPLVQSGHFHVLLGPTNAKSYFMFTRFFNNNHAAVINSTLKTEHTANKSLNFIDSLLTETSKYENTLRTLRNSRLRRGQLYIPASGAKALTPPSPPNP